MKFRSGIISVLEKYDNTRERYIEQLEAANEALRKQVSDLTGLVMSAQSLTDKFKLDAILAGAYDSLRKKSEPPEPGVKMDLTREPTTVPVTDKTTLAELYAKGATTLSDIPLTEVLEYARNVLLTCSKDDDADKGGTGWSEDFSDAANHIQASLDILDKWFKSPAERDYDAEFFDALSDASHRG